MILKITKGDFFALWPNGAGKSSTIGIISSITIKQRKYKDIWCYIDQDFPKAKSFLGVVAQEINFSQFES